MSVTTPAPIAAPTNDALPEPPAAGRLGARAARFAAGVVWVGAVSLACVAPVDAVVPSAATGTRAVWVLTEETGGVTVAAVGTPLDELVGAAALEWAAFPESSLPPLGPQPPPDRPRRPAPRPSTVHRLGPSGFDAVDVDDATAGRLFLSCGVERFEAKPILGADARPDLRSIVPFGDDGVLVTSQTRYVNLSCGEACVQSPAEVIRVTRETRTVLSHPELETTAPGQLLACSDRRGGAWVLDARGGLFHARPESPLRHLGHVKLSSTVDFAPNAMTCWPSDDDTETPAVFLRNFDYDVYYAAPRPSGARPEVIVAQLTDIRRRRFDGLSYVVNGEFFDRMIGVGVDTSVFVAESVDTLRVQFWSRWLWSLRMTATSSVEVTSATIEPPLRLGEELDEPWVVARSAFERTALGTAFVSAELRVPGSLPPQHRLYARLDDGSPFVEVARDVVDAAVLLSFRGLLLGVRDVEGVLLGLDEATPSVGTCATTPVFASPRVGAVTQDGFMVLGGSDAPPVAVDLAR